VKQVDYSEISQSYDDVREADITLMNHLLQHMPSRAGLSVLDIGCGTGNYTSLFQKITQEKGWKICGLDPSKDMLAIARRKNARIVFRQGTAEQIPWESDSFDFIYMTDVIHHVPDIRAMFAEILRVLKPGGSVCIVTQSHKQIEARPIVQFFPGTVRVDKQRYPDIDVIITAAQANGLRPAGQNLLSEGQEVELGAEYLELVRKKGYSMLRLLSDAEYESGLRALEEALRDGPIAARLAGDTLVWFIKARG
jgi:ubiquinone/menaquinone biosynthesis C-methylase UbiE